MKQLDSIRRAEAAVIKAAGKVQYIEDKADPGCGCCVCVLIRAVIWLRKARGEK